MLFYFLITYAPLLGALVRGQKNFKILAVMGKNRELHRLSAADFWRGIRRADVAGAYREQIPAGL